MRLARLTDYAVVLMVQLSLLEEGSRSSAGHLADATGLPVPTATKILKLLAGAGLVRAYRGAKGGYALTRRAQDVNLAEIIATLEGVVTLTACVSDSGLGCALARLCPVRGRWDRVNQSVRQVLESFSLADLHAEVPARYEPGSGRRI